jgi:ABC-type glycerol-3-phosphate transport system permease component
MSSRGRNQPAGMHYTFLERLVRFIQRTPLHILIILICAIWFLPTFSLFVSSFRPPAPRTWRPLPRRKALKSVGSSPGSAPGLLLS